MNSRFLHLTAWGAIAALIWVLAARVFGPSDLYAYTQYKTMSYTTDIIVHGGTRWFLPVYCEQEPATKPPLYNWLAVPFVKWLGFNNELAHKFPSVIALCAVWAIMVRLGRRLDTHANEALGWLAGLIVVANYTIFKLGYVARPDMLLTLWLTLAWALSTQTFVAFAQAKDRAALRTGWLAAGFWICIAAAAMTKGPPAILGIFYALIAARIIGGRWQTISILHPVKGIAATVLIVGPWIFAVWEIDPSHLYENLWKDEVYGRITGSGEEIDQLDGGWQRWLMTIPYHPLYFLSRFLPWSIATIAAMWLLWRRDGSHPDRPRRWRTMPGELGPWLWGAAMQVVLVIIIFTLSTGKRADYLAAAFPPGALLASWWLLQRGPRLAIRAPWVVALLAGLTLAAVTWFNIAQPASPSREYGRHVKQFVDEAALIMAADPLPTAYWVGDVTYLQALLGTSVVDSRESLEAMLASGEPGWIVSLRRTPERDMGPWLEWRARPLRVKAELVLRSEEVATHGPDPARYHLFRVTPLPSSPPSGRAR